MFETLIRQGKMGRPKEICDGRAVSRFRRSELREWSGVVCRRRLLGNLNRTKSRLRNTVPSLGGKRAMLRFAVLGPYQMHATVIANRAKPLNLYRASTAAVWTSAVWNPPFPMLSVSSPSSPEHSGSSCQGWRGPANSGSR